MIQAPLPPERIPSEITRSDQERFFQVIHDIPDNAGRRKIISPATVYPGVQTVLAVHWHPESVPLEWIRLRFKALFPDQERSLVIPTQHNELMVYDDAAGVEVDCCSRRFNQKVQLLLHFSEKRVQNADTLKKMLAHTFQYRSSQLFEFLETLTARHSKRMDSAARETGADAGVISFARTHARKIETLVDDHFKDISPRVFKNKLIRHFFDLLRDDYGDLFIDRVQAFLKAVKKAVKSDFPLDYFYRTSEIIEETRHLDGGIVIPHPEQFWPILLAGYDVDGVEVWNPQSLRYTDFLISVIHRINSEKRSKDRELLVFMGDDTHFGEKIKPPQHQDPAKASREIGVQPAWDRVTAMPGHMKGLMDRDRLITCYRHRIGLTAKGMKDKAAGTREAM